MPRDQLGRRSRFKRAPSGKRIFLTKRDTDILRLLFRYRYLRATQLIAFLRPRSEKRLIERLGDLYHEVALVDRPAIQWRRFDARYMPLVYELSPKGLRHLETCGSLPDRATTFAPKGRTGATPQFDHAMMIVDALVEAEIAAKKAPDQRFVPVDEILARMPERTRHAKQPLAIPVTLRTSHHMPSLTAPMSTHIVPDALYGIEYLIDGEKRYRFFALECENTSPKRRSTAKLSSLVLKQAAYEEIITAKAFKEYWGVPNLELRIRSIDC
ncbi:replication-relaxation family protein [Rhizobium sp. LjRoot254]|uniref:replication-relaxation family protein n=1 Tax=Rhizobium sp. LjRoot254 TaxID=3342297 RepID=UPI003ECCCFD6